MVLVSVSMVGGICLVGGPLNMLEAVDGATASPSSCLVFAELALCALPTGCNFFSHSQMAF